MDFHLVTSTLLREFQTQHINYAVIGGFALGSWGVTRATIDMDLLLLVDDATRAEKILTAQSYRCIHKTENVAQYVSDSVPYGSIDILYAFREVYRHLLERSVEVNVVEGVAIRSLVSEDIIGLKLQALVNEPAREPRDLWDMEALLLARKRGGEQVEWEMLSEYFDLFDRGDLLAELRRKHDETE